MNAAEPTDVPRVVVAGGGFAGVSVVQALHRRFRGAVEVVLVSPRNHMLFQPLLPEVASGAIEPRHAVAPIRQALPRVRFRMGELDGLDPARKTVTVQPPAGDPYELAYTHVVIALGSAPRALLIPGLDEHAVAFSTVAEALHLRNAMLSRLEIAESTQDPDARESALRAVFIGGGYTGVEALAELHYLAQRAAERFENVEPEEIQWTLVEAADRILPNLPLELADRAVVKLRRRGIDVRLGTTVERIDDGRLQLSTGEELLADTVVWSAGVEPHPCVRRLGLDLDDAGRVEVDRTMRVPDHANVWALGDCAAVPRPDGGSYPPTAEQATRQGKQLGSNLARVLQGRAPEAYAHGESAELVTLGSHTAMGTVAGRQLVGKLPWLARRAYYVAQMPSVSRRVRLALEWSLGTAFPNDPTQLDALERPGGPLHRSLMRAESR
ncbi:NAD(P)/FAD-dependent oxidoreductase [Egibacter rhizosphaerae]|nr:NAD(P)/FAD-dependent oxidoreductase [Egibacter rhizosphaerae]